MTDRKCFRLVWTQEAGSRQVFNLSKEVYIIGRQDTADIVIKRQGVSRTHARLTRQGETYTIEDLQSANGTSVDGRPLGEHEIWPLAHGSVIALGSSSTLTVQAAPEDVLAISDPETVARPAPTSGFLKAGDIVGGRFEIREQISVSTFGIVYLAVERELNRLVAIKELMATDTDLDNRDALKQKRRFEREAAALGKFQHPNIISVYHTLHENGADYLVLEYVAGSSLKAQIEKSSHLPVDRSLDIAIDICRAVAALVQQEVVHRDIKPSNILLAADGTAKLSDFGVAQIGNTDRGSLKHPGTVGYMSPEQKKPGDYPLEERYLDERSDLYSLGLVLYEMLSGTAYKNAQKTIRSLNSSVPIWLENLLNKALHPDRDKRYQTAAEMEQALRAGRSGKSSYLGRLPRKPIQAILAGVGLLSIVILLATAVPALTATRYNTATPTGSPTPTSTSTPTLTPTASPTVTFSPTPTEIPAAIPTRVRTIIPETTPTPVCPPGQFYDPVMSKCRKLP